MVLVCLVIQFLLLMQMREIRSESASGVYPGSMQSGTSTASATATASKEIKSVKNSEKGGDLIEGAPKQPEP